MQHVLFASLCIGTFAAVIYSSFFRDFKSVVVGNRYYTKSGQMIHIVEKIVRRDMTVYVARTGEQYYSDGMPVGYIHTTDPRRLFRSVKPTIWRFLPTV